MLAIAGGKGGCGKTTTTLGLARAFVEQGQNPLVVDGDPDMPDIHHRVGLDRSGGIDSLAGGARLADCIERTTALPGVAVLTGGTREALGSALQRVERWDGPILVDCPAGTSREAVVPLRHGDRTVIVSTDQPQCLEDTAVTRKIARRLSTSVSGVVLRQTGTHSRDRSGSRPRVPSEWQILGELPDTDEPLTDPRVREQFRRISAELARRAKTEPGDCAGVTGRGREPDTRQRQFGRNI